MFLTSQLQTINAKDAGALDKDLMDAGGFSLDQLMELAGLSVSQAGRTCLSLRSLEHESTDFVFRVL